MEISKEITFDCAHMLSGYDGPCANLHGHTYHLRATICCPYKQRCPEGTSGNGGMIIDFNKLKDLLQKTVIDLFDHAVIFSSLQLRGPAEQALFQWAQTYKMKHYVLGARTTAENIAVSILSTLESAGPGRFAHNWKVQLWETPTSVVEVGSEEFCK